MAPNFIRKYYPAAAKKSPYVILEPDEYSSMMAEEYVKYSDPHISKLKSFSKLAKLIIILWIFLAALFLFNQVFPTCNTLIFGTKSQSFVQTIQYVFSGDELPALPEDIAAQRNQRILQGLEKCVPGQTYSPDDCNSCRCDDNGALACTKMYCPKVEALHLGDENNNI